MDAPFVSIDKITRNLQRVERLCNDHNITTNEKLDLDVQQNLLPECEDNTYMPFLIKAAVALLHTAMQQKPSLFAK
jgi:hypothetical protein